MKHNVPQEVLDRTARALIAAVDDDDELADELEQLARVDDDAAEIVTCAIRNLAHALELGVLPSVHQGAALNDRGRARKTGRSRVATPAPVSASSNVIDLHGWLEQRARLARQR